MIPAFIFIFEWLYLSDSQLSSRNFYLFQISISSRMVWLVVCAAYYFLRCCPELFVTLKVAFCEQRTNY